MRKLFMPEYKRYILSISHANYLKGGSGIPKVMMSHQKMYNQSGISYISIFSIKKNILHDRIMLFCKFGLVVDGVFCGVFQMSQLIHLFYKWMLADYEMIDVHIHHIMYIKLKFIENLLSSCRDIPVKVYLHDYYLACTCYTLLKNGKTYCGGTGLDENSCRECSTFRRSIATEKKIHKMLDLFIDRITFISPSEITKEIFAHFHPEYLTHIVVIPHQIASDHYVGNLNKVSPTEKMKVAFLGMPKVHKGWTVWKDIVQKCSNGEYEFYVFNSACENYEGMMKVNVAFGPDNLNAMIDALRINKIHVVLLWSIWPETYSYTCFEAFAANSFIITNSESGNIAEVIKMNNNGLILSSESDLQELFRDEKVLRKTVNEFRQVTLGGPNYLFENDAIVKMSLQLSRMGKIIDVHKIVNYPLLWLINIVYK